MTTEFNDQPSAGEPDGGDVMVLECAACGHPSSAHDETANRFCRVSRDRALDRGCICRPAEAPEPAPRTGSPMYGRGRFSGK